MDKPAYNLSGQNTHMKEAKAGERGGPGEGVLFVFIQDLGSRDNSMELTY